MRSTMQRMTWLAVIGTTVLLAACNPAEVRSALAQDTAAGSTQPQLGPPAPLDTITPARLSAAFRAAAERALPAVVSIEVETEIVTTSRQQFPQLPPWLEDVFPQLPEGMPRSAQSAGSGFIFDPRGYIMTNNHVVANSPHVTVKLNDRREYTATVVGGDPNTDVAVIKIEPRNGE